MAPSRPDPPFRLRMSETVSRRIEPHRSPFLWVWSIAVAAFALRRIPYDDEWFSIELALHTEAVHFWAALTNDLHPPWVALADRWIGHLWHHRAGLHFARVLTSAAAFAITAQWLAQRLRLPAPAVWLAAFHPIVFMYGASIRWYPLLLLAHALRAYAVWADRSGARGRAAFIAGAVLGPAAGYVDALFLVHDGVWWLGRRAGSPQRAERTRAWTTAVIAVAAVLAVLWISPLALDHAVGRGMSFSSSALFTWIALGVLGEAGPSMPWLLLGSVVPIAFGRGTWLALRDPASRSFAFYVFTLVFTWAASTAFGVWHARYSLLLWFLLTACTLPLWRRPGLDRALLVAAGGYLCFVLVLMTTRHSFLKTDLNELSASDCELLEPSSDVGLLVVPYQGLAELVQSRCAHDLPMLRVRSIRIVPDEPVQMAPLRAELRTPPPAIWSLHLNARSSYARTDARVRSVLADRCRLVGRRTSGEVPHAGLKALLAGAAPARFTLDRWNCR